MCKIWQYYYMTNNTIGKVTFNQENMLGILDLRSIEYFRVQHGRYKRQDIEYKVQTSFQDKTDFSDITLPESV